MKALALATRNTKEILRDPLNLAFGLGFPLVLILLLSAIQANVPVELFEISHLTPGIAAFGLSFITLFSATLISKDRESSLLRRLYTTPLRPSDFILSYTLPFLPISIVQGAVTFIAAIILGLPVTPNILLTLLFLIPVAFVYVALGLLFGSILGSKTVGGICGALLTNLSAWLSGVWFDLELVGGAFKTVANILPFVHAVELLRCVLSGNFAKILPHFLWVCGYAILLFLLAVLLFCRQMKRS